MVKKGGALGHVLNVLRVVQQKPIDIDGLVVNEILGRSSGTIKMRDYEKEPITKEELEIFERDMKPSSRMFEMEKRDWRYLVPASEYEIKLIND